MAVRAKRIILKIGRKRRINNQGQAAIETGLSLSFIIFLLYYMMNGYHAMHTAHIGQKYSMMNLYQRLDNQSKFVIDQQQGELHGQTFMGVQYLDPDTGAAPRRRILLDRTTQPEIRSRVGICLEPAGGCEP